MKPKQKTEYYVEYKTSNAIDWSLSRRSSFKTKSLAVKHMQEEQVKYETFSFRILKHVTKITEVK